MSRATEFLTAREEILARRLRDASLVCELDLPEREARALLGALSRPYRDLDRAGRTRLLRRYAGCLLAAMAGIGAVEYINGRFWPAVAEVMEMPLGRDDQTMLGESFRNGLDLYGMARFKHFRRVNVDEIMMHSGIPLSLLPDFLNAMLLQQAADPDILTPEEFMQWATGPAERPRLAGPLDRLMRNGGAYVLDLVDRCLELVDRLREPGLVTDGLPLPQSLITRAVELRAAGALHFPHSRDTGSGLGSRPRLMLEPYGRGVTVWLPPIPGTVDGRVEWDLTVGDRPVVVYSASVNPAALHTAPATAHPLTTPVTGIGVALRGFDLELALPVIDPEDPLLIFTDEGRRVPASALLPPAPVWLLHRDDHTVEFQRDPAFSEEPPSPYGWESWRLRHVDLSRVGALRLDGRPWRRVESTGRPRLTGAPPSAEIRTGHDRPVHTTAPDLLLPADGAEATTWTVRIRRPGSAHPLAALDVTVRDEDTTIDPWRDVKRPLVGAYEIAVRGPLGRGLSQTLHLAEGLAVSAEPGWRAMTPSGLQPCRVEAGTVTPGLDVHPEITRLGPRSATAVITVGAHGETCDVQVTPPHMTVRRGGADAETGPSLAPLHLETETVEQGHLVVHLPAAGQRTELVVTARGREMQRIRPSGRHRAGTARFELGRLADTVRVARFADLEIEAGGERFTVARCAPRRLASSATVEDGRLVLHGAMPVEGLTAALYQVCAPWRAPEIVTFDAGLRGTELPELVTTTGDLLVHLWIEDPWVPRPRPRWPGEENTLRVPLAWRPNVPLDNGWPLVSGYLAGRHHVPGGPATARTVLRFYPLAGLPFLPRDETTLRAAAAGALRASPQATLRAVREARLDATATVAALAHAGLFGLRPDLTLGLTDDLALWEFNPVAAVLSSAHRLPRLTLRSELYERIAATCGAEIVATLLSGEDDPHAPVGGFDRATERMAAMNPADVDRIWAASAGSGGGLLEVGERLAAARQLFDARDHPEVRLAARHADQMVRESLTVIEEHPVLERSVRARMHGSGWLALPAASLALCLAARLAARRRGPGWQSVHTNAPYHARLARHAPRLTTVDLLLAELLVTGLDL